MRNGVEENNGVNAQDFLAGRQRAFEFVDYISGEKRSRVEVRLPVEEGEPTRHLGATDVNGQGQAHDVFNALNDAFPVSLPHRHLLHQVQGLTQEVEGERAKVTMTLPDGRKVNSVGESVPHVVADAVQVVLLERTV